MTSSPFTRPTRTCAIGVRNGMSLMATAAEAAIPAKMSGSFSPSNASTCRCTCTSSMKPLGKSGRSGRSIRRAVRISLVEGRPTTKEILTARLIDRPLRPLFPKGFMDEVQVHLHVLAFDGENDPDIFAGIAASAAVAISDIPFLTPIAHVRVGRVNGELVINPTVQQLEYSDFDLVVAGTKHYVNMIELGGREILEDEVADAIEFGHKVIVEVVAMIEELQQKLPREKVGNMKLPDPGFVDSIRARVTDKIREVKGKAGKADRSDAVKQILDELVKEMAPPVTDPNASYMAIIQQKEEAKKIRQVFSEVEEQVTRE